MTSADDLDPNQRGAMLRLIREELAPPRVGRVAKVWAHDSAGDNSNHEVNVAIPPGGSVDEEHRRVPVVQPTTGAAYVPSAGDMVLVTYLDGADPIVLGAVYGDAGDDRAPIAGAGDVRLRRGELYVEAAGDGSTARIAKKSSDDATPDLVVEVDDNGTIRLGDPSGDLQPVARKGDEVEVTLSDGTTGTGEITEASSDVESS